MARSSEKRIATSAAATKQKYTQLMLAVNGVYLLVRLVLQWKSYALFSSSMLVALFLGVNYLTYSHVCKSAALGTTYTTWQDLMFVNIFVQALSLVTTYAILAYLSIPLYLLYQYGYMARNLLGSIFGGMFGGGAPPAELTEEEQAKLEKKQAKRERQQNKVVYK